MYRIFNLYYRVYNWVCGTHPHRRPWHSQWLAVKDIYRDLRRLLPGLKGSLLDIGCLNKPYAPWMTQAEKHIGIDVTPGAAVDYLIREGEPWPLPTGSIQSVLCTQVLQVVKDLEHLLNELDRVLARDGVAVITTPFCYNDMSIQRSDSTYKDYWRHSVHGTVQLFADRFEVTEVRRQGGIGSTVGVLWLNWLHASMSRHVITHFLFILLFPVWLPFCFFINMLGLLLDKLDKTGAFYHNVLLVVRKKSN